MFVIRISRAIVTLAFATFLAAPGAVAGILQPTDDGSAGRDWYSNPNSYWLTNGASTIGSSHDGGSRWLTRGAVIFDISSLWGTTLAAGSATYDFFSYGFNGVQLQYANAGGAAVTAGYANAGGTYIPTLDGTTGWVGFDVTSLLQSSIDANQHYVSFVFPATANYGGGSLAAIEDTQGRGSYLSIAGSDVGVPEPTSIVLAAGGFLLVAGLLRRPRRK